MVMRARALLEGLVTPEEIAAAIAEDCGGTGIHFDAHDRQGLTFLEFVSATGQERELQVQRDVACLVEYDDVTGGVDATLVSMGTDAEGHAILKALLARWGGWLHPHDWDDYPWERVERPAAPAPGMR